MVFEITMWTNDCESHKYSLQPESSTISRFSVEFEDPLLNLVNSFSYHLEKYDRFGLPTLSKPVTSMRRSEWSFRSSFAEYWGGMFHSWCASGKSLQLGSTRMVWSRTLFITTVSTAKSKIGRFFTRFELEIGDPFFGTKRILWNHHRTDLILSNEFLKRQNIWINSDRNQICVGDKELMVHSTQPSSTERNFLKQ